MLKTISLLSERLITNSCRFLSVMKLIKKDMLLQVHGATGKKKQGTKEEIFSEWMDRYLDMIDPLQGDGFRHLPIGKGWKDIYVEYGKDMLLQECEALSKKTFYALKDKNVQT